MCQCSELRFLRGLCRLILPGAAVQAAPDAPEWSGPERTPGGGGVGFSTFFFVFFDDLHEAPKTFPHSAEPLPLRCFFFSPLQSSPSNASASEREKEESRPNGKPRNQPLGTVRDLSQIRVP